jgi:hypothetical protein
MLSLLHQHQGLDVPRSTSVPIEGADCRIERICFNEFNPTTLGWFTGCSCLLGTRKDLMDAANCFCFVDERHEVSRHQDGSLCLHIHKRVVSSIQIGASDKLVDMAKIKGL